MAWVFVAAVSVAVFVLSLQLEHFFHSSGAINEERVFDGDPGEVIRAMADGSARRGLVHPNLPNFFSVPLRALSSVVASVAGESFDQSAWRRQVVGWIFPFCSAVQPLILFSLFRRLGLRTGPAVLFVLLGAFSFSQLIFGALPETFILSGLAITVLLWLAVASATTDTIRWKTAWALTGAFLIGITISNVVVFALLHWTRPIVRERGFWRSCVSTIVAIGFVVLLNVASVVATNLIFRSENQPVAKDVAWTQAWLRPQPLKDFILFPKTFLNSITPSKPITRFDGEPGRRDTLTLEKATDARSVRTVVALALVALLAMTSWLMIRQPGTVWVPILLSCTGVIMFNWVLHSLWGDELLLYSQHWLSPLLVIIAGAYVLAERRTPLAVLPLAIVVVVVGTSNFVVLRHCIQLLSL